MTTTPDPIEPRPGSERVGHATATGTHDTSRKVDSKKSKWWLWPLLGVALLLLALLFFFGGDNDADNSPDLVDQIGNNQPGNCQTDASETGEDQGTGDIAPDDENDC